MTTEREFQFQQGVKEAMVHAQKVAAAKTLKVVEVRLRSTDSRSAYSRIYMWPKAESVMENFLVGRRIRPVKAMKTLIADALKQAGLDPATTVRWSRTAGCSCGCSPGFIADRAFRGPGYTKVDVHVTFDVNEEAT